MRILSFLLTLSWGWFQGNRFFDKVFDEWTGDAQEFIHTRLPHLLVVAAIAFLLIRLLSLITRHMTLAAERHALAQGRAGEVKTLAGVVRATGLTAIAVITGLQVLDAVGLNLGPLLASAGIAGVAIGLAAQTIVKDMFNGVLILIEGQFNIGDTVRIAGVAGTVETMTLRKTTVRDSDGTLYVIPNSQIATVANLSVGYSATTVNVSVDFSADPDKVVALLKQIAFEVRNSEPFKNLFIEDPKIVGVDAMKGSQLIFPVVFKTLPQQQLGPAREFQRRVRLALEEHHLLPGDPNRVFSSFTTEPGGAGQSADALAAHASPAESEIAPVEDPTAPDPPK